MKQTVMVSADVSALAGRFVRLRFRFDTGDALANQTEGVFVDDVAVESPCLPRPCASGADCCQLGLIGSCTPDGCDYSAPFQPLFTTGSGGSGAGQFDDPYDVVLTPDGQRLYVSDKDNDRIHVLDPAGNFLSAFGSWGTGEGQFDAPHGLSIADGRLFVADTNNARIQVFTLAGVPVFSFGKKGKDPGLFQDPKAVLVTGNAVYVADTSNHRIQVFDLDGGFLATFGKYGKEDGNFRSPSCVVMTLDGRLLVCDIQNARIQILTPAGAYLGKIQPKDAAAFGNPYDVAPGPGGRLYVADTYYHRIQVFLSDGTLDFRFGTFGASALQFAYPMGMAFGPDGRLYVVDTSNQRLSVWGQSK
jgi:DNA-binding beta-propeller fold protein YncE